jgi:multiple RNA-binding domain-containing protein 1
MKLSIGNLSTYANEKDLMKLFSAFGNVRSVIIVHDLFTHRSRGMAEVEMETESAALMAIQKLHNTVFMQKALIVKIPLALIKSA